jgi:hypothetical protein
LTPLLQHEDLNLLVEAAYTKPRLHQNCQMLSIVQSAISLRTLTALSGHKIIGHNIMTNINRTYKHLHDSYEILRIVEFWINMSNSSIHFQRKRCIHTSSY